MNIVLYAPFSTSIMKTMTLPFPVIIAKEGAWFVASCPLLSIGTQGKTEQEAKEMIADLISEYLNDPDTQKPDLSDLLSVSLSNVLVNVPKGVCHSIHNQTN